MHWRSVARLFGILLLIYSLGFIPSLVVALLYADGQWWVFVQSIAITLAGGAALLLPNRDHRRELSIREGFLLVALFWLILGIVGALPFYLGLHLNFTDAAFESISGFTTTGATVITGLDTLPPSVLYHRQQIQWLGGMGVIVLAVAILPWMGVGGLQLYRAESSGVSKSDKLTPRIVATARALWLIYAALTAACAMAFWLAGMTLFDAIGHAFTTVATGGFSTHDASLGYFDDPVIEWISVLFMLAGGVNFAIHFFAWHRSSLGEYFRDPEVRTYLLIAALGSLFIALSLWLTHTYASPGTAFRFATVQVVSILTSTGFGTATFADWPLHIPLVLVVLSFIGGCAGSTAGGLKVLRMMLLVKIGTRQLFMLSHPRAVFPVKVGGKPVAYEVLASVWGFYILYIGTALMLTMAMMALGLDLESAFGATVATINLLGPGLGEVAANFVSVSDYVKWLGIFGMLVGRLEVFTLLILFYPPFWRG